MVTPVKSNDVEILCQQEESAQNEEMDIDECFDKFINEHNFKDFKNLFIKHEVKPNHCDQNGITLLQQACFKGNTEIVQFLIDQGADVNYTEHKLEYTALHYAALSGNSDLCLMLLAAGARSYDTNNIGKTASKMAAFVGNHCCVTAINSFVPQKDLDYFVIPRGSETKPKLLPILKSPLYFYIMQLNIHPVRLAMKMPKILLDEYSQVKKVLDLMSEKEMKKGLKWNEVLSFKFHYLGFILTEIHKIVESKKETDPIEAFTKKILKGSRGEEYLDLLLRDCVREFPYRNGFLFRQIVKSLAMKDESPPALSVILHAINDKSFLDEVISPCITCSEPKAIKKCSKCKAVQYCDRECQRLHWFVHKKECARFQTRTSKERVNEVEETVCKNELPNNMQNLTI